MEKLIFYFVFIPIAFLSACNTINISVGKGTSHMEQDTELRDTGIKADVDATDNTVPISAIP